MEILDSDLYLVDVDYSVQIQCPREARHAAT